MTQDLITALRERVAFTPTPPDQYKEMSDADKDCEFGECTENKRLKPLIDGLIECVVALEKLEKASEAFVKWQDSVTLNYIDGTAKEALARLRELVGVK